MLQLFKKFFQRGEPDPPLPPPVEPPAPVPAIATAPAAPGAGEDRDRLSFPATILLKLVPDAIEKRIAALPPNAQFDIPLRAVTEQLPRGVIRFQWKELRAWSRDPIADGNEDEWVTLPLAEVLERLPSGCLKLRPGRPVVEVPPDIPSIFDRQSRNRIAMAAMPSREAEAAPAPAADPAQVPGTLDEKLPPSAAPAPKESGAANDALEIELAEIIDSLPVAIRQIIDTVRPMPQRLRLPLPELEQQIRKGRVAFSWRQLAAWLTPPAPCGPANLADTLVVLPLAVLAPRFMTLTRVSSGKRLDVPETIPAIFGNERQQPSEAKPAEAPAGAIPASPSGGVLSNAAARPESPAPATTAEPFTSDVPDFGTIFGQPDKTFWTPPEIAARVACLPGVKGAVLATADGLLVAAHLPGGLSPEDVAGFLPEAFQRAQQCCRAWSRGESQFVILECAGEAMFIARAKNSYLGALLSQRTAVAPQLQAAARRLAR